MAHGQDPRPIEAADGTKATVQASPQGKTVILTLDPESRATLEAIQTSMERIQALLEFHLG